MTDAALIESERHEVFAMFTLIATARENCVRWRAADGVGPEPASSARQREDKPTENLVCGRK